MEALYEICLRTADAGADASHLFLDGRLVGDVFAAPYAVHDRGLCWVVEADDGRTVGYLVATDDTDGFERWFRDVWWPSRAGEHPLPEPDERYRDARVIGYASGRGSEQERWAARYPAHLHIDLLPETQGQGLGRRLMQTLFDELRRRGVAGAHLGMNPQNAGAGAFYERLGMRMLETYADTTVYGIRFS